MSLADTLIKGTQQSVEKGVGATEAVNNYIQVGNLIEQTKLRRAQVENQKQMHKQRVADGLMSMIENGRKLKGSARSNFINKVIPSYMAMSGADQYFNVDSIPFMLGDQGVANGLSVLRADVLGGNLKLDEAIRLWNSQDDYLNYLKGRGFDVSSLSAMSENDLKSLLEGGDEALLAAGVKREEFDAKAQQINLAERKDRQANLVKLGNMRNAAMTKIDKIASRVKEDISNASNAVRLLKRVKKDPNRQAYNMAINSLLKITQDRISDQDFRLFESQSGIGKLGPFLDSLGGKSPEKTVNNALKVAEELIQGMREQAPELERRLKLRPQIIAESFPNLTNPEREMVALGLDKLSLIPKVNTKEERDINKKLMEDEGMREQLVNSFRNAIKAGKLDIAKKQIKAKLPKLTDKTINELIKQAEGR